MKNYFRLPIVLLLFFCMMASAATIFAAPRKLIIGTKAARPFSFQDENKHWTGISFELWRRIAQRLKISYEVKEYKLDELLTAVKKKKIDAAIAAITITSEREGALDFSHPFFVTGLSIAISAKSDSGWLAVIRKFISYEFLQVVSILFLVLIVAGAVIWYFERKENSSEFPEHAGRGLTAGLWWAAVTMTTVGYGDKSPRSRGGRFAAMIWMFTSVIIISSFTASITSSLTVSELGTDIKGPADLRRVRTGTVKNSTSQKFLTRKQIRYNVFKDHKTGLLALANGKLDAFVYDTAILKYEIQEQNLNWKIKIIPNEFEPQYYGIVLPEGSALREKINRVLLQEISSLEWKRSLNQFLGVD